MQISSFSCNFASAKQEAKCISRTTATHLPYHHRHSPFPFISLPPTSTETCNPQSPKGGFTFCPKGGFTFCPKGALPFAQRGLYLLPKGGFTFCPKGYGPFAQRGADLLTKRVIPFCPKGSYPLYHLLTWRIIINALGHSASAGHTMSGRPSALASIVPKERSNGKAG